MGTIMEHLQAQRDNADVVNMTDATIVTTTANITLVVVDLVDIVVESVYVRQPLFPTIPGRFAATNL